MSKNHRISSNNQDDIEQVERAKARKREIAKIRVQEMLDDEEDDFSDEIRHFVKKASKNWK